MINYLKYTLIPKIICFLQGHKLGVYPIYNEFSIIPDQGAYCKRCGENWEHDVPVTGNLLNRLLRKVKYVIYKLKKLLKVIA
jgi:hypothetical protein